MYRALCCLLGSLLLGTGCLGPGQLILESDNTFVAQPLQICSIAVGQGDSTLLIGPYGATALIDAGPPASAGDKTLPELRQHGVTSLDWALLSHYDADHLGGLLETLQGEDKSWDTDDDITIRGAVWDRGGSPFQPTFWFEQYAAELATRDMRHTLVPGQTLPFDNVKISVVLSGGQYDDGTEIHLNPDEENEASIALLIEYGDFRYLTAGDLTGGGFSGDSDKKDLESYLGALVGPIDVLHINHHGSRTSTNDSYLSELNPDAAIISLGADNDFGHPHPDVINRLTARGIAIYRTDEGTVCVVTDGQDFQVIGPEVQP